MVVGWGFLSPLAKYYNWAPGPVGDMAIGARGWILWTSLAIMSSDSLVALIPTVWEYVSKLVAHADHVSEHDLEVETDDRLVPNRWILWGITCSTTAGILLVWIIFANEGIKPWATLLSFGFGVLLSILGYVACHLFHELAFILARVRALGETDINPVSGLGKISQLLFAVIQPGNVVANIIAGGVAEAGAQQYVGHDSLRVPVLRKSPQGRGPHAGSKDWSPRASVSEGTVLRTTHWINTFYPSHSDRLHSIQQGLYDPRPLISRASGLRLAQPCEVAS